MAPSRVAASSARPDPTSVLCCFAVRPEARFFSLPNVRRLITGIGSRPARLAFQAELGRCLPRLVLSCGFAGGLNPRHPAGTVLFQADRDSGLDGLLAAAGAWPGRFCTSDRVLVTAQEKQALGQASGADAVEMESDAIRSPCRGLGVPSATIRAVSDTALEDLPLDFNRLVNAAGRVSPGRVVLELLRRPGRVPALLRLRRQTELAARNLGAVLSRVLAPGSSP